MKRSKTILYTFFVITTNLITVLSCSESHPPSIKNDMYSEWFLKNEEAINFEINKIISQNIVEDKKDTTWTTKTIVVTEADTTILGEFSKLMKTADKCYVVAYTFDREGKAKKIISVEKDTEMACDNFSYKKVPFTNIDTTKYFVISKQL